VAVEEDAISASFVLPVQFGSQLPSSWHVTSGEVTPFCLEAPFHRIAILGSASVSSGLSQVLPVAESAPYEFSFWGAARNPETSEPPAVAEVFWLGSDCLPLQSVTPVSINSITTPPAAAGKPRADLLFGESVASRERLMQLHRARLNSPAGAKQAEVRFTVPTEGLAAIDRVSLITTSETSVNGDFRHQEAGQLVGWTISGPTTGFRVLSVADGIQLLNAGAATVELVQTAAAKGGEPFTLAFAGRTVAGGANPNPRLEVRWIKADGTTTGSPTAIEIPAASLSSAIASGTAPDDATQAEIRLAVTTGLTLDVKRISLRFFKPTIVPVSFVAETPGELIISDVRVAFDQIESLGPPSPVDLCIPTPPGGTPGDAENCCCHSCESERSTVEAGSGTIPPQPAIALSVVASSDTLAATTVTPLAAMAVFQLTDINGIGEARARQLAVIGIDTVEKLAASTPETVAGIKSITSVMATKIVAEAQALIGSSTK
ncbi:MAG TPA: helix-hairpin-helix domain-containing protein, partial [Pyrinomonadaceae bacterium]|nr:helix-hairpin-helix domain-containing protein [Pyrinomonadaceae bacterium]